MAGRGQPLAHRRGRAQRDLVLGRSAAGEDGDPHGVVPVLVVRASCVVPPSGLRSGLNLPTTIVTFEPFLAFLPPVGLCSSTTPSPSGESDVLALLVDHEALPGQRRDRRRRVLAGHVGHGDLAGLLGHRERDRRARVDLRAALGALREHGARVLVVGLLVRARDLEARPPAGSTAPRRSSCRRRRGPSACGLPLETTSVTDEPLSTFWPSVGLTEIDAGPSRTVSEFSSRSEALQARPSPIARAPTRRSGPTTCGTADLRGPVGHRERHRRALLGLRPARRVLADDLALAAARRSSASVSTLEAVLAQLGLGVGLVGADDRRAPRPSACRAAAARRRARAAGHERPPAATATSARPRAARAAAAARSRVGVGLARRVERRRRHAAR